MANPRGMPQNLKPFPKGVSGNPSGRPKGQSITALVRAELQKPAPEDKSKTNGQIVAERVVELAKEGNTTFTPLVWRYVDGDPKTSAELTLRELVEQLAERMGLDPAALLAEFERDLKASGAA